MSLVVPENNRNQFPVPQFPIRCRSTPFWRCSRFLPVCGVAFMMDREPQVFLSLRGDAMNTSFDGNDSANQMQKPSIRMPFVSAVPGGIILHPSFLTCGAATVRPARQRLGCILSLFLPARYSIRSFSILSLSFDSPMRRKQEPYFPSFTLVLTQAQHGYRLPTHRSSRALRHHPYLDRLSLSRPSDRLMVCTLLDIHVKS